MQFFKQEDRSWFLYLIFSCFFYGNGVLLDVVEILMTASLPSVSATYRTKLLKFFNKLLAQSELGRLRFSPPSCNLLIQTKVLPMF